MAYGNCLLGALILALRHPGGHLIVTRHPPCLVPHLIWCDQQGRRWHYRLCHDILPWPLCYVVFAGKFARHR